ncbi:dTDP-4-amino-4,6-dideoxygalactose transaminase [Elusimicrobiota bacterium]
MKIFFNKPHHSQKEIQNIINCIKSGKISGDGCYTDLCNKWFLKELNRKILLTHSCTCALEMMAILLNLKKDDEIIMPSYSFVSTANAFVLTGAKPVFVDIRPDTLNIDENLVEQAVTKKTKAIIAVHYAGVSCEMDKLQKIAKKHNLYLLEDSALGFNSTYKNKPLGTIGDLGAYSFHETKNIISGEGGCLIINNKKFKDRAEIIREKGTNRSKFLRGEVDKYSWVDIGSSYLPSDIISAFLYGQLQNSKKITKDRIQTWNKYHKFFEKHESAGLITRPFVPEYCTHNGSIYYILFRNLKNRTKFIEYLKENNIFASFHYIPLHSSVAGIKYAKVSSDMNVTNRISDTLVRMPLFYNMTAKQLKKIFKVTEIFFEKVI